MMMLCTSSPLPAHGIFPQKGRIEKLLRRRTANGSVHSITDSLIATQSSYRWLPEAYSTIMFKDTGTIGAKGIIGHLMEYTRMRKGLRKNGMDFRKTIKQISRVNFLHFGAHWGHT